MALPMSYSVVSLINKSVYQMLLFTRESQLTQNLSERQS